jgi:membrane protein DedA with SNARE-associated domain
LKLFIAHLIDWYQHTLDSGGYLLVAALMAIESTVLPVPSELVIPFAAQRAHETGKFSVIGVVIAGTIGSWLGATIMYWASRLAGRPLILRYGRYVLVPEAKLHAAERWCSRFGAFGVFAARLLPVVRHLIGIPMGIVKMDFKLYSIFTLLGSAIWCSILAWVGIKASQSEHSIKLWVIGFVAVLAVIYYIFVHRHMRETQTAQPDTNKREN